VKWSTVLAIGLAFVSIWVVMAAGVAAAWVTEDVRAVGLLTVPTAIVAFLLVLYFDWRAKLERRTLAERPSRHDLDNAAEEKVMLHTHTTSYPSRLPANLAEAPSSGHLPTHERVAPRRERQSELTIDDALAGSFPASDPPAWNPGMARPIPVGSGNPPDDG
jgi:hypothetical protein